MGVEISHAILEIKPLIESYLERLKSVYKSVIIDSTEDYLSLSCEQDSGEKLKLSVVSDYERRNIRLPKNSSEYQFQGGHKELGNKLSSKSEIAWKIDVVNTLPDGKNLEIGFGGGDNNWSINDFERSFLHAFQLKT